MCHWSILPKFQCNRLYFIFHAKEAGRNSVGNRRCSTQHLFKTAAPDVKLLVPRHLPHDARQAPSPVMYHPWHPCGTQRPQLDTAPTMGICSTQGEMGSARHAQQPGSSRSHLLCQQASWETGTTAISLSSPGRRTDRCSRDRQKGIKVEVNALKINVTEVYQEMPVLHSKSHKLSKPNYPLQ